MSKFIDELNQAAQGTPEPIGFRRQEAASPRVRLPLVASLPQAALADPTPYRAADALLLRLSDAGEPALKKIAQAAADRPWGVRVEGDVAGAIKILAEAGCDFFVFPATGTPLGLFEDSEAGRILEVEPSLGEGLLRAVNDLPVDAVIVGRKADAALTWQDAIILQRFASLLTKPLLVPVPAGVTGNELQALWEVGVGGVVLEAADQKQQLLEDLRKAIDDLTPPSPRKRGKIEALVPLVGGGGGESEEEEEEEEDE